MSRVLDQGSLQESLHFAELLQRSSMASIGSRYGRVKDHGVKRAGFYVLAGAQMPAVLYETSFIQKMADAIVNAVRAYRDGL
jgi:N-acetylmuramoyl-L-alanine amidase